MGDNQPDQLGYTKGTHAAAQKRSREQERRDAVTTSRCRMCGARIYWATTSSGKKMPVDATATETGNVMLTLKADGSLEATVVSSSNPAPPGRRVYASHFETCSKYNK